MSLRSQRPKAMLVAHVRVAKLTSATPPAAEGERGA
jgi:hypothetical protein